MATRQSFNELLHSPGPSTPRGRGRGARGGRGFVPDGRGRGGGRGRGSPHIGSSFKSDYSNVAFDYGRIEKQTYVNMAAFAVAPYGPSSGPSGTHDRPSAGRGDWTPRSRGRASFGRGVVGNVDRLTQNTPSRPSGSATPVTGLGFRGKGGPAHQKRLNVTSGTGLWGGGLAPMFVKAGELFKDGEVDIFTLDKNDEIHVDAVPLSDPSAPQMVDLADDEEVEVMEHRKPFLVAKSVRETVSDTWGPSVNEDDRKLERGGNESSGAEAAPIHVTSATRRDARLPDTLPPEGYLDQNADMAIQHVAEDKQLIFVDLKPGEGRDQVPLYHASIASPLGQPSSNLSDEEQIVFAPRAYQQPTPIQIDASTTSPQLSSSEPSGLPEQIFRQPGPRSRAERKAAKRIKRQAKRDKGRKGRRHVARVVDDGSDIDWGTDEDEQVSAVLRDSAGANHELDVAVLRDYLAGTLLNGHDEEDEEDEEEDARARQGEAANMRAKEGTSEIVFEADAVTVPANTSGTAEGEDSGRSSDKIGEREKRESEETNDDMDKESGGDEEAGMKRECSASDDEGSEGSISSSSSSAIFRAMAAEMDNLDGSESEDEDEGVRHFRGKDMWSTETDWFVKSMEDALDGGIMASDRKKRNQVFKAIEDGDFGDDWNLQPFKKGKKNKHVPIQLQNQWEKDRRKKAEKKEHRQMERLLAELNPNLTGRKAKGKNKAYQASLAHLIPASATHVAEMFDVSSDEEDFESMGLNGGMGMGRRSKRDLFLPKTLTVVEQEIRDFLADEKRTTHTLPPMDKEGRMKVHMLAECFDIKSKSRGKGASRFTVLIKTSRSGKSNDEKKIHRLVFASASTGGQFYQALYSRSGGGKEKGKGKSDRGCSTRAKEGDLVGEGAERIKEDNIGHRLLSKMGWAEGDTIGRTGGLDVPIVAIVKYTKRGLGV